MIFRIEAACRLAITGDDVSQALLPEELRAEATQGAVHRGCSWQSLMMKNSRLPDKNTLFRNGRCKGEAGFKVTTDLHGLKDAAQA